MMKTLAVTLALALGACAGRGPAIKAAEVACLKADLDSAKKKLAEGIADPKAATLALTEAELICAFEALFAVAPTAPAPTPAPAQ
jgi:hypothetical protein